MAFPSPQLASLYEVSSELAVRYCDTDGDLITVSSSEELHHMSMCTTRYALALEVFAVARIQLQ